MNILSPRRRAILREIWRRDGHAPSCRELARVVGYSHDNTGAIDFALRALRRGGYISWTDGLARTLTLTGKGLLAAQGYRLLYTCDQDGIHEIR